MCLDEFLAYSYILYKPIKEWFILENPLNIIIEKNICNSGKVLYCIFFK